MNGQYQCKGLLERPETLITCYKLQKSKLATDNTTDGVVYAREIRHLSERFKIVQKSKQKCHVFQHELCTLYLLTRSHCFRR